MNCYGVGLLNAIFALMEGMYVLIKQPGSPLAISFGYFTASVSMWSSFYALWQFQTNADMALIYLRLVVAFCFFVPFSYLWFVLNLVEHPYSSKVLMHKQVLEEILRLPGDVCRWAIAD